MIVQNWFVLRFTGLSWAGKTSLANAVFARLQETWVKRIQQLDGDLVREHITKDLWFTKDDREENIRRITFVAWLLSKHGVWVLATFISPYREMRQYIRTHTTNFIEVFVNAPLAVCEQRDVKWLYAKARKGAIPHFTGISDPYEVPENPEIEVRTDKLPLQQCVNKVVDYITHHGYLSH